MKALIVLLVCLVIPFTSSPKEPAQEDIATYGPSADELTKECGNVYHITSDNRLPNNESFGVGLCIGFISGIIDNDASLAMVIKKTKGDYCIPKGVTTTQIAKVVAKYGNDHPEELYQAGLVIVVESLRKAFPC